MMGTVIIVDDEEMVITSIRAFLQLETEYDVHGFTDPEEALRFVEASPISVAVSDYLMPRINGIQFLGRVKQLQPESTRVLLTGHADKQSAVQAINEVGLFQYLEKPWDNQQLLLVIQSGIERTRLLRDLREKISQLDSAHSSLKDVQRKLLQAFL
ncbi:MAG: response regulator [Acidobacteria bacterium]|nr:response regulator [Acidobacteriota bacterium]